MAKRGIDEHPKVIEFAELLGIPVCYAVGPLELFWHWVAKYRPTGDISGIKPSAIVHAIRFPGTGEQLMNALIESGLVDSATMIVHDWSEHADNSVHQLLKKRGEVFADGHKPFTRNRRNESNDSQTVHEPFTNRSSLPEPEPEPVFLTEAQTASGAQEVKPKPKAKPKSEPVEPDTPGDPFSFTPFDRAARVLSGVAEAIDGYDLPMRPDVVRHLKPDSAIPVLLKFAESRGLVEHGAEEFVVDLFCFAHRHWNKPPTWPSVMAQRSQLAEQMDKPVSREGPKPFVIPKGQLGTTSDELRTTNDRTGVNTEAA